MKVRGPHCDLEFEVPIPVKKVIKINIPTQPQPIKYNDPLGRELIGKDFNQMKGGIKR